jgi:hypothetical protein
MKQIENYPDYYISLTGKVFSLKTMKFLKPSKSIGYGVVNLTNPNKKQKTELVHRLIALAYIPNPNNKPHINHIDGNKGNNNIFNLEWCTPKENMVHAWGMGLNHITERHIENAKRTIKIAAEVGSKLKRKKIIDTSTGKIYDYAGDAAKEFGYRKETLINWLNGHRPNRTTLKYL